MPATKLTVKTLAWIAFSLAMLGLLIGRVPAGANSADDRADYIQATINKSVEFDVLTNDPAGARLVDHTDPAHGSLTTLSNGALRYLPKANYLGPDSFTYQIQAAAGDPMSILVSITVVGEVTAVEARNDRIKIDEDAPATIHALLNDASGPGNAPLTVAIDTAPAFGSASVQPDGSILFTPPPDWTGDDEFTYVASDGITADTAQVSISVNDLPDAPDAVDDHVQMRQGGAAAIDVYANDTEPEGDGFALTNFSQPAHGTTTWSDIDRMIIYLPASDYWGQDQFTYSIADYDGIDTATVLVTVDGAPRVQDDHADTVQGIPVNVAVLLNDSDPEAEELAVSRVTSPKHGTAMMNPDMTIAYQPGKSFTGEDSFTYSVADSRGNERSGQVTVTVTPRTTKRTLSASDDEFLVQEDSPGNTLDLISNDKVAADVYPTIAVDTTPSHGTVTVDALQVVTYVPASDFSGQDVFAYSIVDASGNRSTATVTIEIQAANDPPLAVADTVSGAEDVQIVIDAAANDTDIDFDVLTVESVTKPEHGTARVNKDGAIVYTPASEFVGSDVITYAVSDGQGGSSSATVTITVDAVSDPPKATNDRQKTGIDEPQVIDVLANDTDPDTPFVSIAIVSEPLHGSVAVTADNKIAYAPAPGFEGVDTFKYQVSDGEASDTATVRVTVGQPQSNPTARDDSASTRAASPVVIDTTANDESPSGGSLRMAEVSNPQHGTVSVDDNELTYTPDSGYVGPDSFDYTIEDEDGGSDTATVKIDVSSPKSRNGKDQ